MLHSRSVGTVYFTGFKSGVSHSYFAVLNHQEEVAQVAFRILQTLEKPFHLHGIDRFFIKELARDAKVAHIIKAIVDLGRSLGLRLIAEGVEKPEELDFLKSINCDDVQGYLFYKPLSAQPATELIKEGVRSSRSQEIRNRLSIINYQLSNFNF